MNRQEAIELLRNNSIFWSRLGFENDPPCYDENDKLIEFGGDYTRFAQYHAHMRQVGIRLHTSLLFSGWTGKEGYDYTLTDKTLNALFEAVPDAYYIPRIKLNAPVEWQKKYPEELCVYFGGCDDPEYIRPRVGSLEHDLLGYEAPDGYYMGNNKRPNCGGFFSNQSFASDLWRHDAAKALIALMRHIALTPYGSRIIGYHLAYGVSGETCMWGREGREYGDYSRIFWNAFVSWGKRKYGSEEQLFSVWRTLQMPVPSKRKKQYECIAAFSRARPEDRIISDLDEFTSWLNAETVEYFCRTVKTEAPEMLTGVFYGYILQCYNSGYTGWLDLNSLLNSPWVDFLAAPTSYTRREAGESGGFIAPAQSINLKKIWIDELDIRTYLSSSDPAAEWRIPKECTKAVFYREFSKNLAAGNGYWWMDLGGGWYESDYIHTIIQDLEQLALEIRKRQHQSVADILFIVDERAFMKHTEAPELFRMYLNFQREATLSGTIIDMYRLRDLEDLDLSHYKLIVFCDCPEIPSHLLNLSCFKLFFYLDGVPSEFISRQETKVPFPSGKICFENGFSGDFVIELPAIPHIVLKEDNLHIHARFQDGSPAIVSNETVFYGVLPLLKWKQFRELAKHCGCRTYMEAPCTVYGDNRFLGIFSYDHPETFSFNIR